MKRKWKEIYSMSCLLAPLLMILLLQELSHHGHGHYRVAAAAASASDAASDNNRQQCHGSMAERGEIDEEEVEMLMESESTRRILNARSIGYGALRRDLPACSGSGGEPYSNSCLPPSSNHYNRGCSKIYRCRHS